MSKPRRYQKEVVREVEAFDNRALVAADPGLGKSLISLGLALRNSELRPILAVVPPSLRTNWKREIRKHSQLHCAILIGEKPPQKGIRKIPDIWIIGYSVLSFWLKELLRKQPKYVILDEAQYISNPFAKRSKAAKEICKRAEAVVALSGTPIESRHKEIWHICHVLKPDKFPTFYPFGQRFCSPKRTPWGIDYRGSSNSKELRELLLDNLLIRRTKEEVLSDLPPKIRQVIPLPISDRAEYKLATDNFLSWILQKNPSRLIGALRNAAQTKIGYLLRLAARLKLPSVFSWLDTFLEDSNEKLIMFGIHRSIMEELQDKYRNKSVLIYGGMTDKQRQEAWDAFLGTKKKQILFGNLVAAGTGKSATGVPYSAFCEYGWKPAQHTQGEDRTHGLDRGKEGVVSTSFWLVAEGTIEEKMVKILQSRQKIVTDVLDGGEGEDLPVFDLLLAELIKEKHK